jgi:hypothetical protein
MSNRAYLVLCLSNDLVVRHVAIYSEPPWMMTRMRGDGVMAVLMDCDGSSYQDARDWLVAAYPRFFPTLAAAHPVSP